MRDLIMYAVEKMFVEESVDFICFPDGEGSEEVINRLERLLIDRERFKN